ncbi:hypothetical protein DESC_870028 [Desulfosarcina cetonica]|nr:hypothetical protein DESC_870028 [Desulfosarcina cetonica]
MLNIIVLNIVKTIFNTRIVCYL